MAKYFTANPVGFWDDGLHPAVPPEALAITDDEYDALLDGQSSGMIIAPGSDGRPELVEPAERSPEEVLQSERDRMYATRFQFRAALHIANLKDAGEAAVSAADPLIQIAWADAEGFKRDSPTVAAISATLGLSPVEVDDLFRTGAALQP